MVSILVRSENREKSMEESYQGMMAVSEPSIVAQLNMNLPRQAGPVSSRLQKVTQLEYNPKPRYRTSLLLLLSL